MIRQVARQVYLFSTFQTLKSLNLLSKMGGGGGLFFRVNLDLCFLKPFPAPPSVLYHLPTKPNKTKTDIKLNRLKKKCKFL